MTHLAYQFPRNQFFGFDGIFDTLEKINTNTQKQNGYPPYNVVKKDDDHWLIEIAVAGFSKDDISLTLEKGELTIKGEKKADCCDTGDCDCSDEYVHRGISARAFSRKFTLSDSMKVLGADIVDGLLRVGLENQIPEKDKPVTINLGELTKAGKKLLLG